MRAHAYAYLLERIDTLSSSSLEALVHPGVVKLALEIEQHARKLNASACEAA